MHESHLQKIQEYYSKILYPRQIHRKTWKQFYFRDDLKSDHKWKSSSKPVFVEDTPLTTLRLIRKMVRSTGPSQERYPKTGLLPHKETRFWNFFAVYMVFKLWY